MKVVFVNPPWFKEKEKESVKNLHSITPPLGILYIASFIRQNGHEVSLIDAQAMKLDTNQTVALILEKKPDIVAFTSTTPQITQAFNIIEKFRQKNEDIKIIIGGPHVTVLPEESMQICKKIDYLIIGEGEQTFLELCDALDKGVSVKNIDGLVYRQKDNIVINKPRIFINDLDKLPFPARDLLFNLDIYTLAPSDYKKKPNTTMITSRGCPFRCLYCNKAVFGKKYRFNTPKYVVDEIEHLIEKYNVKEIKIWDDIFTMNRQRTIEICNEILKRKIDLEWSCESRVDVIDEELLKLMKRAGCWQIDYGIESGNQKILNIIQKDISLQQVRNGIKITKKAGISTRGYFILGLPGETIETANNTINFAKSLYLDYGIFFMCVPYPGTRLYDYAIKHEGIKIKDYSSYSSVSFENPIYVPETIDEKDLKKLINEAYKKFYFRPEYIFKRLLMIKSPEDIKRNLSAGITLLKTVFKSSLSKNKHNRSQTA